jgi:hypothetical protein
VRKEPGLDSLCTAWVGPQSTLLRLYCEFVPIGNLCAGGRRRLKLRNTDRRFAPRGYDRQGAQTDAGQQHETSSPDMVLRAQGNQHDVVQALTVGGGNGETEAIAHPPRLARQQGVRNPQSDSFARVNSLRSRSTEIRKGFITGYVKDRSEYSEFFLHRRVSEQLRQRIGLIVVLAVWKRRHFQEEIGEPRG